jgi:hypothetical protein
MASEEVVSCPACRHALRVPVDLLGMQVQCPECKSMFRAPKWQDDGRLGESVLLSSAATVTQRAKRPDWLLMLPAFGLILCGTVSLLLNSMTILNPADPAEKKKAFVELFQKAREAEILTDGPTDQDPKKQEALRRQFDEERADFAVKIEQPAAITCAILAALTLAGGMSIVLRRFYFLAIIGSLTACINLAACCCGPS